MVFLLGEVYCRLSRYIAMAVGMEFTPEMLPPRDTWGADAIAVADSEPEYDREWELLTDIVATHPAKQGTSPPPVATLPARPLQATNHLNQPAVDSKVNASPPSPTLANSLCSLSRKNSVSAEDACQWEKQLAHFATEPGADLFEPGIVETCWGEDWTSSDIDSWAGESTDGEKSDGDVGKDGGEEEIVKLADKAGRMLDSKLEDIRVAVQGFPSPDSCGKGIIPLGRDGIEMEDATAEGSQEKGIAEPRFNFTDTSTRVLDATTDALSTCRWGDSQAPGDGACQKEENLPVLSVEKHQMDPNLKAEERSGVLSTEGDSVVALANIESAERAEVTTNPASGVEKNEQDIKTCLGVNRLDPPLGFCDCDTLERLVKASNELLAKLEVGGVDNESGKGGVDNESAKDCESIGASQYGEGTEYQDINMHENTGGSQGRRNDDHEESNTDGKEDHDHMMASCSSHTASVGELLTWPWKFPTWAIRARNQLDALLCDPSAAFYYDERNIELIYGIHELEDALDETLIYWLSRDCSCFDSSDACIQYLHSFTHPDLRGAGKWLIERHNSVDVRACWEGYLEDMYPLVMELIHRNWWNRGLHPEEAEASMREHLEFEGGCWVMSFIVPFTRRGDYPRKGGRCTSMQPGIYLDDEVQKFLYYYGGEEESAEVQQDAPSEIQPERTKLEVRRFEESTAVHMSPEILRGAIFYSVDEDTLVSIRQFLDDYVVNRDAASQGPNRTQPRLEGDHRAIISRDISPTEPALLDQVQTFTLGNGRGDLEHEANLQEHRNDASTALKDTGYLGQGDEIAQLQYNEPKDLVPDSVFDPPAEAGQSHLPRQVEHLREQWIKQGRDYAEVIQDDDAGLADTQKTLQRKHTGKSIVPVVPEDGLVYSEKEVQDGRRGDEKDVMTQGTIPTVDPEELVFPQNKIQRRKKRTRRGKRKNGKRNKQGEGDAAHDAENEEGHTTPPPPLMDRKNPVAAMETSQNKHTGKHVVPVVLEDGVVLAEETIQNKSRRKQNSPSQQSAQTASTQTASTQTASTQDTYCTSLVLPDTLVCSGLAILVGVISALVTFVRMSM